MTTRQTDWRQRFLTPEGAGSVLVALLVVFFYVQGDAAPFIDSLLQGNRPGFYGTLASINGSLLGFAIAVTSIVVGLSTSERLSVLRESPAFAEVWWIFSATTKLLGLATLVSLACLLFDRDHAPSKFWAVLLIIVMFPTVAYLGRTVWAIDTIVSLEMMRPSQRTRPTAYPSLE